MTQTTLWQEQQQTNQFAELCNALYERELSLLANLDTDNVKAIQGRLQSLPYYVQKAAHAMVNTDSPLILDSQNAAWTAKQSRTMPLSGQSVADVWQWYQSSQLVVGLVVPVKEGSHIVLDCIDRVDNANNRFRTNIHGWFGVKNVETERCQLLKPTKKIMMASCAGHTWQNDAPCRPIIPSLRELLLSCSINWKNLKKPLMLKTTH
ncbi:hypothetical protein HII17_00085 [Thalassotalea sp. M1531]|uniref:Uncharacterized protein n=1 Tax=Thalassotalea algicola TaxID=2716224 RepID=A0A7Y0Q5P6_9GAMM|nr:hypothetical protein [Thalassotalea algicola]NMP29942.1 hypothetical protein [Thalassotalea algicola]